MPRSVIPLSPVVAPTGDAVAGATADIQTVDAAVGTIAEASVYEAEHGGSPGSNPRSSNATGRFTGWVAPNVQGAWYYQAHITPPVSNPLGLGEYFEPFDVPLSAWNRMEAAGDHGFETGIVGDATPRVYVQADGTVVFGLTGDITLGRSSAGTLRIQNPTTPVSGDGIVMDVEIDAPAGRWSSLTWLNSTVPKWTIRKSPGSFFSIYDETAGQEVLSFAGGSTTVGTAQVRMNQRPLLAATSMFEYGLIGTWDASIHAPFRMSCNIGDADRTTPTFLNGTNGPRGDSLLDDSPNTSAFTSWGPHLRVANFDGRGSYLGDYNVLTMEEIEQTVAVGSIASNGGPNLVRITHGGVPNLVTGNTVQMAGVTGTGASNVNGNWIVTVISGTQFDLQGSVFTGSPSGGTIQRAAYHEGCTYEGVLYAQSLGALSKTNEFFADVAAGKPGRITGTDQVMLERNAYPAYDDGAVFSSTAPSRWTGARAYRAISIGPQPVGTAYSAMNGTGAAGFVRYMAFEKDGNDQFVVDGDGRLGLGGPTLRHTTSLFYRISLQATAGDKSEGIGFGDLAGTHVAPILYRGANQVLSCDQNFSVGTTVSGGGATGPGIYFNKVGAWETQRTTGNIFNQWKVAGDANPTMRIDFMGVHSFGPGGASALDTILKRAGAGIVSVTKLGIAAGSIIAAAVGGAQAKKFELFDDTGASIGFVPVYAS